MKIMAKKNRSQRSGSLFRDRDYPNNQYPNNVSTTTANTGRSTR
jgi:hypothetical protein